MDSNAKQTLTSQLRRLQRKVSRSNQLVLATFKPTKLWQGPYLDGWLTLVDVGYSIRFSLVSYWAEFVGEIHPPANFSQEYIADYVLAKITKEYKKLAQEIRDRDRKESCGESSCSRIH